jgi:hypothetical protein
LFVFVGFTLIEIWEGFEFIFFKRRDMSMRSFSRKRETEREAPENRGFIRVINQRVREV